MICLLLFWPDLSGIILTIVSMTLVMVKQLLLSEASGVVLTNGDIRSMTYDDGKLEAYVVMKAMIVN